MNLKDKWRALAAELGFDFKEGIRAVLESPSLSSLASTELKGKDIEQAKVLLSNPLVQGVLDQIFLGAATGTRQGFEFAVHRSTESQSTTPSARSTPWVHVTLLFARNLNLGLTVRQRDIWDSLGMFLAPRRFLALGVEPAIRKKLLAAAKDKPGAAALLATPEMTAALNALFAEPGNYKITDHCMRWKEQGDIISKERAEQIMDHLAKAAGFLPDHVTRLAVVEPDATT